MLTALALPIPMEPHQTTLRVRRGIQEVRETVVAPRQLPNNGREDPHPPLRPSLTFRCPLPWRGDLGLRR